MGSWYRAAVGVVASTAFLLSGDTAQIQSQSQRVIAALARYADMRGEGETEEPFSTDVTYCRDNRALLEKYHPGEYELFYGGGGGGLEICITGPPPPGAVINEVPYYNQCDFPDTEGGIEGKYVPCASGCGPASVKMELEFAGLGEQDLYTLYDLLWTGSVSGTSAESIERVLTDMGVFGGQYINLSWEEMERHIARGNVIHMNIRGSRGKILPYANERYCGEFCPDSGHHIIIVGIAEDEVIIHDPYSSFDREHRRAGEYLVVRRDTLERKLYGRWNPMIVVMPSGSSPDELVETPQGAYFDYFPTGWPDQIGKKFHEGVWWQIGEKHTGIDWFGRRGENIYAVKDGTVAGLGCLKCSDPETAETGYGLAVALYHGEIDGLPLYTLYGHLDSALVEFGEEVKAGEVIGTMGSSGFSVPKDTVHLHFSVALENPFFDPWNEFGEGGQYKWVDPALFLGMDDADKE